MTLSTTSPGDEREAAGWVNEWSDKHEVPLDNRARAELVAALSRQAPAAPAEAAWANFPSYLIDHCEGETITEEGLQRWLAEMLADPKYTGPTTTSVKVKVLGNGWVESGLAARDESGSYVMMLHPEATNSIPESDPPIQRPRAWSCSREAKGHGRCVAWCGVEPSCISSQSLAAPTPAEPQALLGWTRYEKARKLNPAQWAELHQRNLKGENFDDMIDALPATTQPVQQAAPTPAEPAQCKGNPPGECQYHGACMYACGGEPAKTEAEVFDAAWEAIKAHEFASVREKLSVAELRALFAMTHRVFSYHDAYRSAMDEMYLWKRRALSTPPTPEAERDRLRAEQAASVMPLIGPLLDEWEGIDNDTKGTIKEEAPDLARHLGSISRAMEGEAEPVQQDTRPPMQTWWFKELQEFWESSDSYITAAIKSAMDHIRATPPAEKQAAPSGEDNHG